MLFLKAIFWYTVILITLSINQIIPMEVIMSLLRKPEEIDMRICGDCMMAIRNPRDRIAPGCILTCMVERKPVHRAKSVNFCKKYKGRGD